MNFTKYFQSSVTEFCIILSLPLWVSTLSLRVPETNYGKVCESIDFWEKHRRILASVPLWRKSSLKKMQMENHNYSTRKSLVTCESVRSKMKPSTFYSVPMDHTSSKHNHQPGYIYRCGAYIFLFFYTCKVRRRILLCVLQGIIYWNQTQPELQKSTHVYV